MLAIYISIIVVGVMMAIFGPRGFLLGLGTVLITTVCVLGKTLKVIFDILEVIDIILNILSLFG